MHSKASCCTPLLGVPPTGLCVARRISFKRVSITFVKQRLSKQQICLGALGFKSTTPHNFKALFLAACECTHKNETPGFSFSWDLPTWFRLVPDFGLQFSHACSINLVGARQPVVERSSSIAGPGFSTSVFLSVWEKKWEKGLWQGMP